MEILIFIIQLVVSVFVADFFFKLGYKEGVKDTKKLGIEEGVGR